MGSSLDWRPSRGRRRRSQQEEKTKAWFATALMSKADELLSEPPTIEKIDILASKLSE